MRGAGMQRGRWGAGRGVSRRQLAPPALPRANKIARSDHLVVLHALLDLGDGLGGVEALGAHCRG